MLAIRFYQYVGEFEFQLRLGVTPEECDAQLQSWPNLDDAAGDSDGCLLVNGALNEVCHGVHFPSGHWARWFTVTREEVKAVYMRWRTLRGWSHTGLR